METESLISGLYEAALEPQRWNDVLVHLRQRAGSQGAALMFGHPTGARVGISVGHSPESELDYGRYYNALDPLIGFGWGRPPGTWCNDWRVVGPRFGKTEYYNDFYRKHGWHACAALILHMEETFWACVSFQRAQGKEPFDLELEQDIGRLLPHLRLAFRLYRETESLRSVSRLSESALESLDIALWAVDARGKIAYANTLAENVLVKRAGLACMEGCLQLVDGNRAAFQAALRAATSETPRAAWVQLPHTQQTLTIMPAPASMPGAARLALVLLKTGSRKAAPKEALLALYGLTAREAEIAWLVGSGLNPKQVAEVSKLSSETVRTYLKSVYAKTGFRTQAKLVRGLAPLLGGGAS